MRISLVLAASKNWVIGKDGKLPWHLPEDLKQFKELTVGKTVIMGNTTFKSLPFNGGLPKRRNIVLSKSNYAGERGLIGGSVGTIGPDGTPRTGVIETSYWMARDIEHALSLCNSEDEVFVIGGSQIYSLFLPSADRIYLTQLDREVTGDVYVDPSITDGFEISSVNQYPDATIPYSLTIYDRRKPSDDTKPTDPTS